MKKILLFLLVLAVLMPVFAHAAAFSNISTLIKEFIDVIDLLVKAILGLALLFFFWGLARFILNAGDEEARKAGKNIMIWGIIAFFVMLSVWALVGILQEAIVPSGGSNPFPPGGSQIPPPTNWGNIQG